MVKSSLSRQLMKLVGPIFIEALLMMLLGATDTFMLSRHSDNSVAAAGLDNQILNLVFLIFQVISIATSILCSQYIGARRRDKFVQTVGVSIILNFLSGLFISLCFIFGSSAVLALMGVRPDIFPVARSYMMIVGGAAVFQAVSFSVSAALRSADKAYYPMYVSIVINVLNIIGNYTLIFGKFGFPELGVTGAAISTAFSRGVAMCINLLILKKKLIPKFPKEYFRPFPWSEAGKLLNIGIPSAGEQFSYALSQVVITYFINMLGNQALATRSYCANIVMFTYLFALSMAQGGAILIGHLVGMDKIQAAYLVGKRNLKLATISTVCLSLTVAACGHLILPMLTSDPVILKVGYIVLWVDVLVENGRAINMFAVDALRAAGDIYFPVILSTCACWTIAVAGSYLMGIAFAGGLAAMWAAFALDENFRGVIFIRRWNSKKWAGKKLIR